jgi:hypothetical protein
MSDRLARNSVDGGKIIYLCDIGKILELKFPTFWLCKSVDNTKELFFAWRKALLINI